jgi:hypothetical protein
MKKIVFYAIVALMSEIIMLSCSRPLTTMQQSVVVTQVKQTKKGVQVKVKRFGTATPVSSQQFKVGDTVKVLTQQK